MSAELIALVHHEARLLDAARYEEWVALFAPDALYWVPAHPAMRSPREGPSHFHDDIQILMARTHRLANPRAFGAEPAPRTVHVVSGVEAAADGDTGHAASAQIMLEWRDRGNYEADQRLFGGRVEHRFRREGGQWRITLKRIDLINATGAFNAMLAPL